MAAKNSTLTQERLKEMLHYDPLTGIFRWIKKSRKPGYYEYGYIRIYIDGKQYRAHHLAWLYMKGELPTHDIDHDDRVRDNNIWTNLRPTIKALNGQNKVKPMSTNKLGIMGASETKRGGRYEARIGANGKRYHLGSFSTPEEASAAYFRAKRILHPHCHI